MAVLQRFLSQEFNLALEPPVVHPFSAPALTSAGFQDGGLRGMLPVRYRGQHRDK